MSIEYMARSSRHTCFGVCFEICIIDDGEEGCGSNWMRLVGPMIDE